MKATIVSLLVTVFSILAGNVHSQYYFIHYTVTATDICEGQYVQYTDLSEGTPIGWEWTFKGGSPATSTLQNPSVSYPTKGNWDVIFRVTYTTGSQVRGVLDAMNVSVCNGVDEQSGNEIKIYPNPAKGVVYLRGYRDATVLIFNSLGQLINKTAIEGGTPVPVADLAPGVYIVQLGDKGNVCKKLIID